VTHAEALLVDKVGMLRLNNIWGVGGGAQPVKALTRQIYMLLQEFLSSNDATEADRCVRELEVPHFHHELVYEVCHVECNSLLAYLTDSDLSWTTSFIDFITMASIF